MSPAPSRRRRILTVVAVVIVLLAGAGVAVYLAFVRAPGNVSNPDVAFTVDTAPTVTTPPTTTTAKPRPAAPVGLDWPRYGYTEARTRALQSVPATLRPPFRRRWKVTGNVLLEFPPALAGNRLYQLSDGAKLRAFDKRTGRILWRHLIGRLAASTPAVAGGLVYCTVLERTKDGPGRIIAVRASDGRTVWVKNLQSRSESSPLVTGGRVYFGTEGGTLYALDARTGREIWQYQASGAVKGGPALSNGVLFVGDYGGEVHAVRAATGKRVWSTSTAGGSFGRSGTFYSTPAVKYGRVYIGNTDGRVYSFAQDSGRLAWATRTGNYVYAPPVAATVPRLGPTIYIGSYDGNLYAIDAKSGSVRWSSGAGGRISGGATLVGSVVYVAELGNRRTLGFDARTGRKVFTFPDGGFDPVISDGRWIFLTGYSNLYALAPVGDATPVPPPAPVTTGPTRTTP